MFGNRLFFIICTYALFLLNTVYGQAIEEPLDSLTTIQNINTPKTDSLHATDLEGNGLLIDNVMSFFQGQNVGLYVWANSFTPGASSRMTYRGQRSFYGDNQPIVFWNGIPLDNSEWNNTLGGSDQSNRLMDMDPSAIQNLEVMNSMVKRASYGIWGGNGVIQTDSRDRVKGPIQVAFTSAISRKLVGQLPSLQSTYGPGRTQNGETVYLGPGTSNRFSWGPEIADLIYDGNSSFPYDSNGDLYVANGTPGQRAIIYNPYDFFQNGISFYNQLNFKGGEDRFSYYTTASYTTEEGVIPLNAYKKLNISPNFYVDITDKWSLDLNSYYSSSSARRNHTGSNLQGIALGVFRTPVTFDNSNGSSDPINDPTAYLIPGPLIGGMIRSSSTGIYANPYWSLNNNNNLSSTSRKIAVLHNTYELNEVIQFEASLGIDSYLHQNTGDLAANPAIGSLSQFFNHEIRHRGTNADLKAVFSDSLFQRLSIESSLGFQLYSSTSDYDLRDDLNAVLERSVYSIHQLRNGSYLNFKAGYDSWLNVMGTIRMDDSNKFGLDTNGFLSYGLGFDLSLSDLLISRGLLNADFPFGFGSYGSFGKFGNSYGGREDRGRYAPTTISGDGFISAGNIDSYELNSVTRSSDLNSEVVQGSELGISIKHPKTRTSVNLLYYIEESSDLITIDDIASSSGFEFLESNFGRMNNEGIELSISSIPFNGKLFKWKTEMTFLKNSNLVEAVGPNSVLETLGGFNVTNSVIANNQPYGSINGSAFLRENGQLVMDANGFPLSNSGRSIIGNPNPDWVMSLFSGMKLGKRIDISALLEIKQGGDLWCGTCGVQDYFGLSQLSADERGAVVTFNGVTESGEVNTQAAQLAPFNDTYTNYYRVRYGFTGLSEMNIFDASWIKLRNISISLDLSNKKILQSLKDLKLGIYAENLLLNSTFPGIDPETNLTGNSGALGLEYYNNPSSETYGIFIKAQF